jgi:hypothetical protein
METVRKKVLTGHRHPSVLSKESLAGTLELFVEGRKREGGRKEKKGRKGNRRKEERRKEKEKKEVLNPLTRTPWQCVPRMGSEYCGG